MQRTEDSPLAEADIGKQTGVYSLWHRGILGICALLYSLTTEVGWRRLPCAYPVCSSTYKHFQAHISNVTF